MTAADRRSTALPVLLLGGVAATFAWLVLRARRPAPQPAHSGPPVGRVGEPGPNWAVQEKVRIERPAGEVAQFLHDHGGLPGLTGGRQGPVMDRIDWELPGTGHLEAEVHGLPGDGHTELTVRVDPQRSGARAAAEHATAAVLGTTARAQVRTCLEEVRRVLETVPPQDRAIAASADPGSDR